MFQLINSKYAKALELGMDADFQYNFQSQSFSDPLPPAIGIPHGDNDISDVPRYGNPVAKRADHGAKVDKVKTSPMGHSVNVPQNQPMVPGSTVHTINRTNNGHSPLGIRPALADAGFSPVDGGFMCEKVIDSTKCDVTGFTKRKKLVAFGDEDDPSRAVELTSYYNNMGQYIGDEKTAMFLHEKGIYPELASDDHKVCSVGFCEKENKWYGWSHRAMYGFGEGDVTKPGDCSYKPATIEGFAEWLVQDAMRSTTQKIDVRIDRENNRVHLTQDQGNVGSSECFEFKPGPGEWTAGNLADARNMACDFAESVSSAPIEERESKLGDIFSVFAQEIDRIFADAERAKLNQGAGGGISLASTSASAVYPPLNFRWYKAVKGSRAKLPDIRDPEIEYSLEKGEKFGIYLNEADGNVHLVTDEDLSFMFVASPAQAKRLLANAKGFSGKIMGLSVKRGNGKIDELIATKPLGRSKDATSTKLKIAQPKAADVKRPLVNKGKVTTKIKANPDKKIYLAFYKPDLDRDRFEIHTDFNKNKLTKLVKGRAESKMNLGSEVFIAEVLERHPLARKASQGVAYVREAIVQAFRDHNKVSQLKVDNRVGALAVQVPARNPTPVNIDVPIGPGIEIVSLRKLRDQIEQHKKISAAFKVRAKDNSRPSDRGFYSHQGVTILQFISPEASKLYEREAKAFVRRIKSELGKMFKATWKELEVVENSKRVKRIVITVFPNIKKGTPELRKRNKELYRGMNDRTLDKNKSYIARTKNGDVEVNFVGVDWNSGELIVKPIRANLAEFKTNSLFDLTSRNQVV